MTIKLEKHLILNKYFLNLFGFNNFNELREKLKDAEEGYETTGRSYFVDVLIGLKPEDWEVELLRYDEAIREYVERLRLNRRQPNFNLKYFQYLAVLFTEIFLDRYYNDGERFLNELNAFLGEFNNESRTEITPFTEEDLKKLAFWMATGSGKTLIMHINYWQVLKYSKNSWDNIILITPNEGLSKQHYEELKLSGIPCKLYDGNLDNLKTRDGEILIIDIYKLTEQKKGGGVSVDISYFDGRNLVFIDEGHKGQGTEEQKWKRLREEIGKNGFLFEYSATFGQVVDKNKDLLEEYAKAIIFDYSYKYFYTDGYGKDFYVYNIKAQKVDDKEIYSENQQYLLLTGGLLSFYEQLKVFEERKENLREYNIEKPLWVFVGSKVSGNGINSDIRTVIKFLDKITSDKNYLEGNVKKILNGQSGLVDNEGNDIFQDQFKIIRNTNTNIDLLIEDIYKRVFGGKGRLEVYKLRNADGEMGLKIATEEQYFGVINVGDTNNLANLLSNSGITVKEDHLSQSLFFGINDSNSHINILIGSKKFIEGWNSWRVSNMGLINMGKGEGPQIIQLFGRGVRLKGKDYSLKREENPDYGLKVLQTLFIFGLNADYISAFLKAMEQEDISYETIVIPIKFNQALKWEGKIYTIKTSDKFDFLKVPVKLMKDDSILEKVNIDLRPKIMLAHGSSVETVRKTRNGALEIPSEYFDIIDWNYIYSEIMNYKIAKGMHNLIIDIDEIKQIVKSDKYQICLNETSGIVKKNNRGKLVLNITSFDGVRKFHEIILMVVKDYILKFYKAKEREAEMENLTVEPLTINQHSYMYPEDNKIILKIPKELKDDIKRVKQQLDDWNNGIMPYDWQNINSSFIIHLDYHLYTPIIVWDKSKGAIQSIPAKLNKGETKFVKDFYNFLIRNKDKFSDYEIFLLRNLAKRGIGFFLSSAFYPDFIIWINNQQKRYMVFIDPKGIRNLGNFNDAKIQLCTKYIKDIEERINEELKSRGETVNLQLDAFIISVSPYKDIRDIFDKGNVRKTEFEEHKIIFQEDDDYIGKIFKLINLC